METDPTRRLDRRRHDKGRSRRRPTADAERRSRRNAKAEITRNAEPPAHPQGRGPSSGWIHRIPQRLYRRSL